MPAINYKTVEENVCALRAMEQWTASLSRPDLSEEDRVRGAIEAYQRQAYVFNEMGEFKTLYRHKKRGTVYEIVSFGKFQASDLFLKGYNIFYQIETYKTVDMIEVVVYRNINDQEEVWVRPKTEFFDGRFENIKE
jgi:hypothetical protein